MIDIIIIIKGVKDIEIVKKLTRGFDTGQTYKVLSCAWGIDDECLKQGVSVHYFSEYTSITIPEAKEMERQLFVLLTKDMPECQIQGSTLKDLFTIDKVSLWDALWRVMFNWDYYLYLRYIGLIQSIIEIERPKKVIFSPSAPWFSIIFDSFAGQYGIEIVKMTDPRFEMKFKKSVKAMVRFAGRWAALWIKIIKAWSAGCSKNTVSPSTPKRRFLFLNTTPTMLRTFLPVMRNIAGNAQNEISLIMFSEGRSMKRLKEEKIAYHTVDDYLNLRLVPKIHSAEKRLKNAWQHIQKNRSEIETITYKGVSLWQFIEPHIEYILFNACDPIAEYIVLIRHILEKERPDVIAFTDECDVIIKMLTHLAADLGIPVLKIQYALLEPFDLLKIEADKVAVTGSFFKDQLARSQVMPEEKLAVTGQPRYDTFYKNVPVNRKELCAKYSIDPDKKTALFASTYFYYASYGEDVDPWAFQQYYRWLRAIYTALSRLEDVQLLVKPHHNPGDPLNMHTKIIQELDTAGRFTILPPMSIITDFMKISDVFITIGSTTVLEAVDLELPMVVVNLYGQVDPMEYLREGIATIVEKESDIYPSVKQMLEDKGLQERIKENQRRIKERLLHTPDGKASERIAALFEKMIKTTAVS